MLHIRHLRRQSQIDGHALADGVRVDPQTLSAIAVQAAAASIVPVAIVLRQRQPFVQPPRPEEQCERAAELATHRAVQNEVDARVNQGQNVH